MRRISVFFICVPLLFLTGCSNAAKQLYSIEPVKVNVPVSFYLEKPSRPVWTKQLTTPEYLLKVIQYTENLELIIDEHNKGLSNVYR